jgi:hypothetical protein
MAMSRGARYAAVALLLLTLIVGAANLLATFGEVGALRSAVLTQCKFNADLGAAPIVVSPETGKASLLGVTIVSDARVAWRGLGCTGLLPAPAPSFVRWAKFYHLPDQ